MAQAKDNYDSEDVPAALKRETADGSGFDKDASELPPSDFISFSGDDVETIEEDTQ